MEIVYRIDGGSVVFAERNRAAYVAQIRKALEDSKTWGELRRNLPDGEWEDYLQPHFEDYEEEVPADDEPFQSADAPGHGDGDCPAWLAQEQLDSFPPELIKKYDGGVGPSVLNGEFLDLPSDKAEHIAEDLRAMGHTVDTFWSSNATPAVGSLDVSRVRPQGTGLALVARHDHVVEPIRPV
jgi:hypothetical protein